MIALILLLGIVCIEAFSYVKENGNEFIQSRTK